MRSHWFLYLFLFSSCAKFGYVVNQGSGQLGLEFRGRSNQDVIEDSEVKTKDKEKIKKIIEYKNFFYKYMKEEKTSIYDQTTFLKSEAVTYLVIASPKNQIKALEHSFPIAGKFPYLGFFDEEDAIEYAKELVEENYDVYVRKVYAYSTLNQWIFNDNILSSFFYFQGVELAELIFHELFHTVFFISDEVKLNENLAQFFSRELAEIYFAKETEKLKRIRILRKRERVLASIISNLARELNQLYAKHEDHFEEVRKNFIKNKLKPILKKECDRLGISQCWPLDQEWNNAHFVSFLTYEAKQNLIEDYFLKQDLDLYDFYQYIKKRFKKYDKKDRDISFQEFLLKENQ